MSNKYDSLKKLSLTFNGCTFYILLNIITHICNYFKRKACIALYVDIQALIIFDLKLIFVKSLIKTIKKDKSWALAK